MVRFPSVRKNFLRLKFEDLVRVFTPSAVLLACRCRYPKVAVSPGYFASGLVKNGGR